MLHQLSLILYFGLDSMDAVFTCAGCGGHVGHVFKSSRYPPPKRERHCVNSVSLMFVPEPATAGA